MKKLIYILFAVFAIGLSSCGGGDNSCVKEIATLIENGAQKEQAFEAAVASGEKTDADLQEDDMFVRPEGNAFANAEVKAIIEQHSNYKLTAEDKDILKSAIDKLCPETPNRYQPTSAGRMLDNLKSAERASAIENIDNAKTLGDLL